MTRETIYCDRCGKECERIRYNRGFHLFRRYYHYLRTINYDQVDLCQDCMDGLEKWMKGENE